jgi:hypothetical protein
VVDAGVAAPEIAAPAPPGRTSAGRQKAPRRTGACDPPFTIDADGLRHFKPDCL